jgi:hypothetical protein
MADLAFTGGASGASSAAAVDHGDCEKFIKEMSTEEPVLMNGKLDRQSNERLYDLILLVCTLNLTLKPQELVKRVNGYLPSARHWPREMISAICDITPLGASSSILLLNPHRSAVLRYTSKVDLPRLNGGLTNTGNSCYANSALMSLANTAPDLFFVLERLPLERGMLAHHLRKFWRALKDNNGPFAPDLELTRFNKFGGTQQHDSSEYLMRLLVELSSELKRFPLAEEILKRLYKIPIFTTNCCMNCTDFKARVGYDYCTLEGIPSWGIVSLEYLLQHKFQPNTTEKSYCESCLTMTPRAECFVCSGPSGSNILCLFLIRDAKNKHTSVQVPPKLNINGAIYVWTAAIAHTGGDVNGGHYRAFLFPATLAHHYEINDAVVSATNVLPPGEQWTTLFYSKAAPPAPPPAPLVTPTPSAAHVTPTLELWRELAHHDTIAPFELDPILRFIKDNRVNLDTLRTFLIDQAREKNFAKDVVQFADAFIERLKSLNIIRTLHFVFFFLLLFSFSFPLILSSLFRSSFLHTCLLTAMHLVNSGEIDYDNIEFHDARLRNFAPVREAVALREEYFNSALPKAVACHHENPQYVFLFKLEDRVTRLQKELDQNLLESASGGRAACVHTNEHRYHYGPAGGGRHFNWRRDSESHFAQGLFGGRVCVSKTAT